MFTARPDTMPGFTWLPNTVRGGDALFGVPFCGQNDEPGVAHDRPDYIDYTDMPVCTPDQLRIESVLEDLRLHECHVLHVGVGNSQFARRFSNRCQAIDGITISPREREHGAKLGLPNYRVVRANKYAVSLPAKLNASYDLIVDNNLASFACCGFHVMAMFSSYRLMLKPGGCLFTDQQGMNWTAGDPRWRLTRSDLERIGSSFGLQVNSIGDQVYVLRRP